MSIRLRASLLGVKLALLYPTSALAHVSEQGFVLLLPTEVYASAGVAVVALTVIALFAVPEGIIRGLFQARTFNGLDFEALSLGPIRPLVTLPSMLGVWPAVVLLLAFAAFLLADIAPDDPARLAYLVGFYWLLTMVGLVLCGPAWLGQVELGSVLFSNYSDLAPLRWCAKGGVGCPGWRLLKRGPVRAGGLFALTLLAVGSFDGLNETFWWLSTIGVNPLAFPGRSAVVLPTLLGLIGALGGLVAIFALTIWLGLRLVREKAELPKTFDRLALSMLPIAFAYHIAHYLTAFLVNGQYMLAALSDPLASGADLLGIQPFYVTTGFFNHIDSVRIIWLTQAGTVVIGHVWSVLLAHRIALDLFPDHRRASLATLPLSIFMIGYLGLVRFKKSLTERSGQIVCVQTRFR